MVKGSGPVNMGAVFSTLTARLSGGRWEPLNLDFALAFLAAGWICKMKRADFRTFTIIILLGALLLFLVGSCQDGIDMGEEVLFGAGGVSLIAEAGADVPATEVAAGGAGA